MLMVQNGQLISRLLIVLALSIYVIWFKVYLQCILRILLLIILVFWAMEHFHWYPRCIICNLKGEFWSQMFKFVVCEKKSRLRKITIIKAEKNIHTFIVKAFGRIPSPVSVRREVLLHFKIAELDTSKFHGHFFSRVHSSFEPKHSILNSKETDSGLRTSLALFREDWTRSNFCSTGRIMASLKRAAHQLNA